MQEEKRKILEIGDAASANHSMTLKQQTMRRIEEDVSFSIIYASFSKAFALFIRPSVKKTRHYHALLKIDSSSLNNN